MRKPIPRPPTYEPAEIERLAVEVYKRRLEDDAPGNVARMLEKDADGGVKLARRAQSYAPVVRAVLDALQEAR